MGEIEVDQAAQVILGAAASGKQIIWHSNDDRHLILGSSRSGHTAVTVDP